MLIKSILGVLLATTVCNAVNPTIKYEYYSGKEATEQQLSYYEQRGATKACVIDIEPCDGSENEGRRVDASCNNPKYPARGTHFSPLPRVQPAHFTDFDQSRKSLSGKYLENERIIRLRLLHEERSYSPEFTELFTGFAISMFLDIGSVHDVENNLVFNTGCCDRPNDKTCANLQLRPDDPIYRYSGITCMNMTMPLTHQHYGCTNDPVASPIQNATATFDLSHIYNYENEGDRMVRTYKGGMLEVEEDDEGKIWPPNCSEDLIPRRCPLNNEGETRCFGKQLNALLPTNLFTIWFLRQHNYFAKELAKVNPCWSDQKVFTVARDINIATSMQIMLYEWMKNAIGDRNLQRFGVIGNSEGFRDVYDSNMYPFITLEYTYVIRYFHVAQQGVALMTKEDGTFVQEYPLVNLTFHTGYLDNNDNLAQITQGVFRQPCSEMNHGVDYEMANNGNPKLFRAEDVCAQDLKKGRLFGVAPYVDYLDYCFGAQIECFDDLRPYMSDKVIEKMKHLYDHPRDIDLLAGAWVENILEGGKIPQTVACLLSDAIAKNIRGDRHWYERRSRPHAFTRKQLKEIRKYTVASLLCNVGDTVTEIQKHAFRVISPQNPLVSCSEIPNIDFSAWADPTCYAKHSRGGRDSRMHRRQPRW